MTETRIELTESQFRKFVEEVWDEAFCHGENRIMTCEEAWDRSLSRSAMEMMIGLEQAENGEQR